MKTKELVRRVYCGENLLQRILPRFFKSKKVRKRILGAVRENAPMMIYESGNCGDGILYNALKNAGCKTVRSYQIDKEMGNMKNNTAYFTIYLNEDLPDEFLGG